jgi:hypothetical protein
MKRVALLAVALLALLAAACAAPPSAAPPSALAGSALAASATTASAASRAADSSFVQRAASDNGLPAVYNCEFKPQTRPSDFVLTCADYGDSLIDLHWVSWGSSEAFATATEHINDCTPYCASPAAKFINYPALVALWRPEPVPGHPGDRYFSRVTRIYTANIPPHYGCTGPNTPTCYPQTATFDLGY